MKLQELNNIEKILGQSHDDVGGGGKPIQNIYEGIRDHHKPALDSDEVMDTFITFIEFLLKNKMVKLAGIYDYDNNNEVNWEGADQEVIEMLKEWVRKCPRKKLENDPEYFFDFKYCFLVWQVDWPIDLEKYGIKSA